MVVSILSGEDQRQNTARLLAALSVTRSQRDREGFKRKFRGGAPSISGLPGLLQGPKRM